MNNEMLELISLLNKYTVLYDEGKSPISDSEWDAMYFKLVELEKAAGYSYPDSPTQSIKYEIVNQLNKVTHNHDMLSLAKTKSVQEVFDFIKTISAIGMAKLDGLTCSLRYVDGELVSAETRGDGHIGEDILHNAITFAGVPLKIPYKDELIVDGEIICCNEDFEAFKDEYKNPRNFASGSARLLDSKECKKRKLTFVAWDVIKGYEEVDSLYKCLCNLRELGFVVVPNVYLYDISFETLEKFIEAGKGVYGIVYPIDGLVFKVDSREKGSSMGKTAHHFNNAMAFKFVEEEEETRLLDIVYEPSRNGQLTPVAIFEPVELEGTTVERCSLFNLSVMREKLGMNPYVGQPLWIVKRNQIIPYIERASTETKGGEAIFIDQPKCCPSCGGQLEEKVSDTGTVTLWCENTACDLKLINILDHVFGKKGLDMKGLSKATFEKFIDWGFITDVKDVFELDKHKIELINKPGFGVKSVEKILNSINNGKKCSLDKVISCAGIPLVGSTVSKMLAKEFKTWDSFRNAESFLSLDGIGAEMNQSLLNFNYSTIDFIVENYLDVQEFKTEENVQNNLHEQIICITGKLSIFKNREELKTAIESRGGKVTGSVSGKTNYLINNDKDSETSKNQTAKKLNIPILTEAEFKEKFLD